jgi:acyl-CoA dehydrogenase
MNLAPFSTDQIADIHASVGMREAASRREAGAQMGAEAKVANLFAGHASWQAASAFLQTHGGLGFAGQYHVERKFCETRPHLAPISTNRVLSYPAGRPLGLPRSS